MTATERLPLKRVYAARSYASGVGFLPQTVVIGRDGRIIKRTFGIRQKADFESDVRQSLATP